MHQMHDLVDKVWYDWNNMLLVRIIKIGLLVYGENVFLYFRNIFTLILTLFSSENII